MRCMMHRNYVLAEIFNFLFFLFVFALKIFFHLPNRAVQERKIQSEWLHRNDCTWSAHFVQMLYKKICLVNENEIVIL